MTDRWTAETEELVARKICYRFRTRHWDDIDEDDRKVFLADSGAILTALADVGLLARPDIEANLQYGRLMPNGRVLASSLPDPTHYRINGPWVAVSEP